MWFTQWAQVALKNEKNMINVIIQYIHFLNFTLVTALQCFSNEQSLNIMKVYEIHNHVLFSKCILKDLNVSEKASLILLKRFSSKSSERVDIMFTEPESSLKTNKEQMQLLFTLS